jgi:glyoxylase-like metal-dependent hydrolase (beta-lactamase superfamily II)
MKIDSLILGAYETNCYILRRDGSAKDCIIIDTGLNARELTIFLEQNELDPVVVVLTHGHIDHIAGLVELRRRYLGVKVYIHKLDAEMLTGAASNLSEWTGETFSTGPADFLMKEGDVIELAGIKLEVLHTPGHTPGGVSLYSRDEGIVFVGDTLFAGSVGRTDFPCGSMERLIRSIKEKLLTLPKETVVYPGHGPATTVAREKADNPYL